MNNFIYENSTKVYFGQGCVKEFLSSLTRDSRNILLMVRATRNLDLHTDSLMQSLIHNHFAEHTIITLAHHTEKILDLECVEGFHEGSFWSLVNCEH